MGDDKLIATDVAQLFFTRIVSFFGVSKSILCDRDPKFTSQVWTNLWKLLGTSVLASSSHYSQTNGQIERTHRTLE